MFSNYASYKNELSHFQSSDGRMAYFDKGDGACILLLHGVPTSSWLYRKIIPLLLKKGFRVIAPDMLGYGGSDKPVGYDIYSDANMGKRILHLMSHLKIDSWSQVFHDGGGLWTWAMLEQDKNKVNHLFMLNTIVYQEGFRPPIKFEKGLIAKWFTRMYSHSGFFQKITIDPTFKNGIKHKNNITKSMLEGYKKPLLKIGHHSLYYFFTQTCKNITDYTDLHRSIDVPLTVIWGEWDDILRWKENESMVKSNFKITDNDIHLLDGKHFIQEEFPEEIASIIGDSLSNLNT